MIQSEFCLSCKRIESRERKWISIANGPEKYYCNGMHDLKRPSGENGLGYNLLNFIIECMILYAC